MIYLIVGGFIVALCIIMTWFSNKKGTNHVSEEDSFERINKVESQESIDSDLTHLNSRNLFQEINKQFNQHTD